MFLFKNLQWFVLIITSFSMMLYSECWAICTTQECSNLGERDREGFYRALAREVSQCSASFRNSRSKNVFQKREELFLLSHICWLGNSDLERRRAGKVAWSMVIWGPLWDLFSPSGTRTKIIQDLQHSLAYLDVHCIMLSQARVFYFFITGSS